MKNHGERTKQYVAKVEKAEAKYPVVTTATLSDDTPLLTEFSTVLHSRSNPNNKVLWPIMVALANQKPTPNNFIPCVQRSNTAKYVKSFEDSFGVTNGSKTPVQALADFKEFASTVFPVVKITDVSFVSNKPITAPKISIKEALANYNACNLTEQDVIKLLSTLEWDEKFRFPMLPASTSSPSLPVSSSSSSSTN